MQRGKIIMQEAWYDTAIYSMQKVTLFYIIRWWTFLSRFKRFKKFHVFNVLALFIFSIVYYISGAWCCISAVYVQ